jgi:hypothetical protein
MTEPRKEAVRWASGLDSSKCPACGGTDLTQAGALQEGRLAFRYWACACGFGRLSHAVTVQVWMTGNPAAVAAVEEYRAVARVLGEEKIA